MKTIVRIHEMALQEFRAWRHRNTLPPTGSIQMARLLEAELLEVLSRTHGKPEGTLIVEGSVPQVWQWRFHDDTWIHYTIKEKKQGLFRSMTRKVVIISIRHLPPPQ